MVMDRQLDLLVSQKRGQAKSRRDAQLLSLEMLEKSEDVRDL
jgi:hypothetical protein